MGKAEYVDSQSCVTTAPRLIDVPGGRDITEADTAAGCSSSGDALSMQAEPFENETACRCPLATSRDPERPSSVDTCCGDLVDASARVAGARGDSCEETESIMVDVCSRNFPVAVDIGNGP